MTNNRITTKPLVTEVAYNVRGKTGWSKRTMTGVGALVEVTLDESFDDYVTVREVKDKARQFRIARKTLLESTKEA